MPADDFQQVPEEDKARIEQKTRAAEGQLDELIAELSGKGYTEAAAYVRNAKDRLFTYVRFWLATALVSPRASSMIERAATRDWHYVATENLLDMRVPRAYTVNGITSCVCSRA